MHRILQFKMCSVRRPLFPRLPRHSGPIDQCCRDKATPVEFSNQRQSRGNDVSASISGSSYTAVQIKLLPFVWQVSGFKVFLEEHKPNNCWKALHVVSTQ